MSAMSRFQKQNRLSACGTMMPKSLNRYASVDANYVPATATFGITLSIFVDQAAAINWARFREKER
jgi:hypothetical protein